MLFSGRQILLLGSPTAGSWSPSGCSAMLPVAPSRRMDTRRGHSPLELGIEAQRPVSFRSGSWKPFLNAHWGFSGEPGRMRPEPPLAPQAPRVLASLTALCRGGCMGMAPRGGQMHGGGRMDTRRGHSPLELGIEAQRPVSFRSGSWKPFLNAHWGFTQGGLACESTLHCSPDPGYSLRSLLLYVGGCMGMASRGGQMHGGGRTDTRRGHSPLERGGSVQRPVSFSTGDWKPFQMLTGDSAGNLAACGQNPRLLPRPLGYSLRLLPYAGADVWGWLRGAGRCMGEAEWTRGEVIRRLSVVARRCGSFRYAPGLGNPS